MIFISDLQSVSRRT